MSALDAWFWLWCWFVIYDLSLNLNLVVDNFSFFYICSVVWSCGFRFVSSYVLDASVWQGGFSRVLWYVFRHSYPFTVSVACDKGNKRPIGWVGSRTLEGTEHRSERILVQECEDNTQSSSNDRFRGVWSFLLRIFAQYRYEGAFFRLVAFFCWLFLVDWVWMGYGCYAPLGLCDQGFLEVEKNNVRNSNRQQHSFWSGEATVQSGG